MVEKEYGHGSVDGNPQISIIIPVYNCEKYLEESLFGIINQTYGDFEVICVDDHITDNSFQILDKYAREDSRFQIIRNKTSQGAGISRNIGLSYARAPYVIFLDADDIFEPDLLEHVYDTAQKTDADIILLKHNLFIDGQEMGYTLDKCEKFSQGNNANPYYVYSIADWGNDFFIIHTMYPWNKLIRRELIIDKGIQFQNLKSSNDVKFGLIVLSLAKKIVWVNTNKRLLHYRTQTPTQISANRDCMNVYRAFEAAKTELQKHKLWDRFYNQYAVYFIHSMQYSMLNSHSEENKKYFYEFLAREGLGRLDFTDRIENSGLNKAYKQIYQKIQTEAYETRWFQANVFQMELEIYKKELEELFCVLKSRKLKMALWGCGKFGLFFLEECQKNKWLLDYVIDSDEKKQGNVLFEKTVYAFESICQSVDVIIVPSSGYYQEVCNEVRNKNIIVFSLPLYFEKSIDLESFLRWENEKTDIR